MDDFRRTPVNRVPQQGSPTQPPSPPQPEVPGRSWTHPAPQETSRYATQTPIPSAQPVTPPPVENIPTQPLTAETGMQSLPPKKSRRKVMMWSLIGIALLIVASLGAVWFWYTAQLAPVDANNTDKQVVTVRSGATPSQIAELLEGEEVIRSANAFLWYTRVNGLQNKLQAGSYRLSPSESTPEIVGHLTSGKADSFSITFLPGATLADNRKVFIDAGYSADEVDAAFAKTYDSPLFAGKPESADLEGYIYGETYSFGTDATVETILEYTFDYFYGVIEENDLVAKYEAQGLSLFEGITLASIVQREASPGGDDMPQIAQVFYSRLAIDMVLGSDVTYQYIADKTGVQRDPNLDSPYNTRRYPGLPPGPIASPGEKALVAVANPAQGDYLYFLSGDDDVTYYGRTLDEHEANIRNHCQKKCQII